MEPTGSLALLANIWFFIIGLFLVFYVVLDGFDLGVGILSLFTRQENRLEVMMTSLGTIWDANETWIVIVAGTMFGAFPMAFGVIFHALYIPTILMLFALLLRGVAFEFRSESHRKEIWGWAFGVGSLVAAASQGLALGGLLQGPQVADGRFVGGVFDWLTPFSLVVAAGVVAGYALLGATYLMMRTRGPIQAAMYGRARYLAAFMLLAAAIVSLWTPLRYEWVAERWFSLPAFYYYAALPALALFAFWMLLSSMVRRQTVAPFVWTLVIFVSSFAGLAATFFPYIVPDSVKIYEAAAAPNTLIFMLSVVSFFIPIMIVYNAYQYFVFRGKVDEQSAGYGQ